MQPEPVKKMTPLDRSRTIERATARSLPRLGVESDRSTVLIDNPLGNGQPESDAFRCPLIAFAGTFARDQRDGAGSTT